MDAKCNVREVEISDGGFVAVENGWVLSEILQVDTLA